MQNLFGALMQFNRVLNKLPSQSGKVLRRFVNKETRQSKESAKENNAEGFDIKSKAITAIRNNGNKLLQKRTLYLLNPSVAKQFADLIMTKPAKNVSYVAEVNSGLGLLTDELIKAGMSSVHMFEGNSFFYPHLKNIESRYPGKASLQAIDFHDIWAVGYLDFRDNTTVMQKMFGSVEQRNWEDDPTIQLVAGLADIRFIIRLMSTLIYQTTLAKYGRMVLHAAIPPSQWTLLTCTNEAYDLYRARSVLFQLIFDYELLGSLPRTAFYPNYRRVKKKRNNIVRMAISRNDNKLMHVVRIEPKRNLFTDGFNKNDIIPFTYFVKHHLKARNTRVIPALEVWIPGCGRALINKGFDIYTKFGELTPMEIFNLFKLFRSWPEYKRSTFVSCMNTTFLKLDENIALSTNHDEYEDDETFELSPIHEDSSVDHQSREVTTTKKL